MSSPLFAAFSLVGRGRWASYASISVCPLAKSGLFFTLEPLDVPPVGVVDILGRKKACFFDSSVVALLGRGLDELGEVGGSVSVSLDSGGLAAVMAVAFSECIGWFHRTLFHTGVTILLDNGHQLA